MGTLRPKLPGRYLQDPSYARGLAPPRGAGACMHRLTGQWHCGDLRVELELPAELVSYGPRECDCDFCRKHGAAYVSDREGTMRVSAKAKIRSAWYRQGS